MTYSWVTPNTRKFMQKGYLTGQSVEQRCEEIASAFESRLLSMGMDDEKASNLASRFLSNLAAGHYSLATPVWVSYGNDRGLPISCFNSDVDDTMDGILYAASEVGMLTKMGGGTSGYLGKIRPRGTPITGNGEADGAAHFARLFNTMMQVSRQGSRRGYFAAYLDAHHGDIMEFLDIGSDSSDIQNITTAVCFNDQFMKSALMGDEQAQKVIAKFHKSRGSHGYPYALFTDNANRGRPKVYKDLDLRINSSNLCVTGDTNILTKDGYKPIKSLAGQTVECWNGNEWSLTPIFQTSESQEILEVVLSNGQTIKATPYHKWYVAKQDSRGKLIGEELKRTHELLPNDKLVKYNLSPVDHGTKELVHAYTNGIYTAEGTVQTNGKPRISLYGTKKVLAPFITGNYSETVDSNNRLNVYFQNDVLESKFFVPDSSYSVQSRLEWLAGLFDGDGCLTNNKGTESLQLVSVNLKFLNQLHLLLQELGVDAKVSKFRDAEYRKLPANDGTGQYKDYWCQEAYRIMIAGSQLQKLLSIGFTCYRVMPTTRTQNREATQFVKVLEVIDNNELLPTYCGTEPKRNKLMFNGVLAGNCNEIMLPSTPDESYVCVLSSMNLVNYDQWKATDAVELLIYFLDTVVEESIDKLKKLRAKQKYHFLDRIERFLAKHRALGMGVLGYHHLLQSKLIPFESRDAAKLNYEIFKLLRERTYTASANLAHWFGEPELLKGYGMRNTTTMAIAPTKSSSFILGNVSEGIQPEIANVYLADLAKETVVVRNPYLEKWLISVDKNTQPIWDAIEAHGGAIPETPDFDFIPDNIREVFKTFPQINPKAIIDQAATRQEFIDQGQSLNLIFHPEVTSGEINDLFYYAWKTGIKGLYYQIGMSAVQAANAKRINMRECVACSS